MLLLSAAQSLFVTVGRTAQSATRPLLSLTAAAVVLSTPATSYAQATNIDTARPSYGSSTLGTTLNPVFQGGTLTVDEVNSIHGENFTLDASNTNNIFLNGQNITLTGGFSDAVAGQPGQIIINNVDQNANLTLAGPSSHTGGTIINNATVTAFSVSALGDPNGTTTLNNGVLTLKTDQGQNTFTQNGGIVGGASNFTVNNYNLNGGSVNSETTITAAGPMMLTAGTVNGVLNGTGNLVKGGTGAVTLA
ncbi:MAG: hypothetical protein M3N26_09735, partial [Pseudomonadota bacterium]|nr:hypothetical protein [Pseudomonadota bacterium]